MLKNYSFLLCVFALILGLTSFVFAGNRQQCEGQYKVGFLTPHGSVSQSIKIGQFKTSMSCGRTGSKRCKEKIVSMAHNCMDMHWSSKFKSQPVECEFSNISNYQIKNLDEFIRGEVCDYLDFVGGYSINDVKVEVEALTSGDKNCKKLIPLSRDMIINCESNLKDIENNLTPIITDRFLRNRYYRTVSMCPNHKCEHLRGDTSRYNQCLDGLKCATEASLFYDDESMQKNQIISAYNAPYDNTYIGCGRKVTQNLLHFFDINLTQQEIAKSVKGHSFGRITDNIATLPSELEKGLREILKQYNHLNVSVTRHSGKTQKDIVSHLQRGFPVIALVDGGTHWVVVTATKSSFFSIDNSKRLFYVQNNWGNEIRSWSDLSLTFAPGGSAWSIIANLSPANSYKPGTIIVFREN